MRIATAGRAILSALTATVAININVPDATWGISRPTKEPVALMLVQADYTGTI